MICRGISIRLTGPNADETARTLAVRCIELGHAAEVMDAVLVAKLGGADTADVVCGLLARNGVIVIATYPGARPEGECLDVVISVHDTPDFAAEKALDTLAEHKIVSLDETEYTPEDEEQVRRRLADLGYVE